jgi:hypothetical protein
VTTTARGRRRVAPRSGGASSRRPRRVASRSGGARSRRRPRRRVVPRSAAASNRGPRRGRSRSRLAMRRRAGTRPARRAGGRIAHANRGVRSPTRHGANVRGKRASPHPRRRNASRRGSVRPHGRNLATSAGYAMAVSGDAARPARLLDSRT